MILIFDTIKDNDASFRFSQSMRRILGSKYTYKIVRLFGSDLNLDYKAFDRVIISGSELSASKSHIEESDVFSIINEFIFGCKPILGICYGHQMLARALNGGDCCIPAETPEFGFTKVTLDEDNILFKGISNPEIMESHFDQVVDLDDSFKIIATNDKTKIQAFQWGDNLVWGVQFHPEMSYLEGEAMLNRFSDDKDVVKYSNFDCKDVEKSKQNELVITNFCDL